MSRLRTPKVSHLVGRQRAVARSAAWSLFRPSETRLPYGYRAELAQVMICSELGIDDCDFTNGAAYIADWLGKLRDDKKEVFRAASDAQRIADYLLAFHPAYAQRTGGGEEQNTQEPDASVESASSPMREAA
jgi:antirestriction protein ArdC